MRATIQIMNLWQREKPAKKFTIEFDADPDLWGIYKERKAALGDDEEPWVVVASAVTEYLQDHLLDPIEEDRRRVTIDVSKQDIQVSGDKALDELEAMLGELNLALQWEGSGEEFLEEMNRQRLERLERQEAAIEDTIQALSEPFRWGFCFSCGFSHLHDKVEDGWHCSNCGHVAGELEGYDG